MTSRGTSPSPASLSSSPGRIEAQRAENGPSITAPSCGSSLSSPETSILIFHWGGHWKDTNCWWHFLSHHPPQWHSPGAPLKSRQAIPKSSQKHPEFNGRQLGDQIHCKVANAMTCLNSSHWSRKASKRRIHDMLMVSSGRCVRSGSSEAQLADVSRGPTAPTQLDRLSSCMPRTPAMSMSKVPNITFATQKMSSWLKEWENKSKDQKAFNLKSFKQPNAPFSATASKVENLLSDYKSSYSVVIGY